MLVFVVCVRVHLDVLQGTRRLPGDLGELDSHATALDEVTRHNFVVLI